MFINKIKTASTRGMRREIFFRRPGGKKNIGIRIGYLVEYSLHNGQKISKYINKISFLFLSLPARIKHGSELSQIIFFISYLFSSLCPFYFLFIFQNNIFFLSLFKFICIWRNWISTCRFDPLKKKGWRIFPIGPSWFFLGLMCALSISLFNQSFFFFLMNWINHTLFVILISK